jgi:hypothetical protein
MNPPRQPFDIENLTALGDYLAQVGLLSEGEAATFSTLPGGVSSRTVLVERNDGRGLVLKQSLPKLRVAVDWFSDPSRIHREALGLRWASQLAPPKSVPYLLFEDVREHILGMEAVPRPHENWKRMLLAGAHCEDQVIQFARWLGVMHRQSWLQRDEVAPKFDDRSFFITLRVEPYYQYTAAKVPPAAPFLDDLIKATMERRLALVHGDYSPKNVLIHAGRLVVIDYEVIHWGDPAFDLGFALTHLLSKANHLQPLRVNFMGAAKCFFRQYVEELEDVSWTGDLEQYAVKHALGCLLARVAGRSPLEYLDATQRERQRTAVLELISHPPQKVDDMVDEFVSCLEPPCP